MSWLDEYMSIVLEYSNPYDSAEYQYLKYSNADETEDLNALLPVMEDEVFTKYHDEALDTLIDSLRTKR